MAKRPRHEKEEQMRAGRGSLWMTSFALLSTKDMQKTHTSGGSGVKTIGQHASQNAPPVP